MLYIIFVFYTCFCLSSCQIYPLYYHSNTNDRKHINPISVFVSSDFEKELSRSLDFLLSHVLTQNKYKLNVVLSDSINNISVEYYFNSTGHIDLNAVYSLQEISKENVLYKGKTIIKSSFDFSNQQFSKMRIIRDIKKKAIRELAENISLDIISFIKNID